MKSIFTADLHLKVSQSDDDYGRFFHFLNAASRLFDSIYILGDLFNYWYEHPRLDLGENNPALKAMKRVSAKGTKIYFLYGNRDFAAGKYFRIHSGVRFLGDRLELERGGKKILLCHGDFLAKKDIRYQLWRKMIRSPFASFIFKHMPVSGAVAFADAVKQKGQGKISYKKVARMIEEGVRAEFKKGYDVIIAGHAHYKMEKGYIVNGIKKRLCLLPEHSYPGEFLVMDEKGRMEFRKLS